MHSEDYLRTLQAFGSGNAQGGISLGGNLTSGGDDDDRETSAVIRDVFIILAVGLGLVGGLVLLTYTLAIVSDKYCCCCPWFRPVSNMTDFQSGFDRGVVARKARLWGLTLEERSQILSAFFEKRVFLYERKHHPKEESGEKKLDAAGEIENEKDSEAAKESEQAGKESEVEITFEKERAAASAEEETEIAESGGQSADAKVDAKKTEAGDEKSDAKSEDANEEKSEDEASNGGLAQALTESVTQVAAEAVKALSAVVSGSGTMSDSEEQSDEDKMEKGESKKAGEGDEEEEEDEGALDDADHERICCICLNEYEEGCKLITGIKCVHQFHFSCCMEWLQKNDQCPYCREEMITASEFRKAALETLGADRVRELGAPAGNQEEQPTVVAVPPTGDGENSNNDSANAETAEGQPSNNAQASEPASTAGGATADKPEEEAVETAGDVETGQEKTEEEEEDKEPVPEDSPKPTTTAVESTTTPEGGEDTDDEQTNGENKPLTTTEEKSTTNSVDNV